MRIEPSQEFAGVPAIKIRKLLRKVGTAGLIGPEFVSAVLEVSAEQAAAVIAVLERDEFIERDERGPAWWSTTVKGNAMALATAAKPLRRRSAEEILRRFLERVESVRRDPTYLYAVERVVLFGSLAADKPIVNDIDLGIALRRKEGDEERFKAEAKKLRRASGRRFSCYEDWLCWPSTHVMRFLKSRSRATSLHPLDDWVLEQTNARTLYFYHDDAPGQRLLFATNGL